MILYKPTSLLLSKAKYTKRWRGKDGKWHYEYPRVRKPVKHELPTESRAIMAHVKDVAPKLASIANVVYNNWDQDDEGYAEGYGSGGICDDIATAISDELSDLGYETFTLYNEYDYHTSTYIVNHNTETIVKVDVPPYVYEEGLGYIWKKKSNVVITHRDIVTEDMSGFYDDWFDENGELQDY